MSELNTFEKLVYREYVLKNLQPIYDDHPLVDDYYYMGTLSKMGRKRVKVYRNKSYIVPRIYAIDINNKQICYEAEQTFVNHGLPALMTSIIFGQCQCHQGVPMKKMDAANKLFTNLMADTQIEEITERKKKLKK